MNNVLLSFAAFLLSLLLLHQSMNASSGGVIGRATASGCGGAGCHGSRNSTTTVSVLEAVDGKVLVPAGGSVTLTLRIAHSSATAAGCNITARTSLNGVAKAGALSTISGEGLQLFQNELTHSAPKTITGGVADFKFTWEAPPLNGTYFLHAAANAVNRNGNASGDQWNLMEAVQLVVSSVDNVFETGNAVSSISPLPAHGPVTISAAVVPGSPVHVSIIDAAGSVVRQETSIANTDTFQYVWDGRADNGSHVGSGTYAVAILNERKVFSGMAIIIR